MDVFIHIPKTAGSTIRTVLAREYGVGHILYFEPNSAHPAWALDRSGEAPLEAQIKQHSVRLITGHAPFGLHATLRTPCRYFSFVREPAERIVSDFFYAYTEADHRWRDNIRSGSLTLEEFVTKPKYGMRAEQTAFLAGSWKSLHGAAECAAEIAKGSLLSIGTTERFRESILLTAKIMGWKPPLYVPRNVSLLSDQIQERKLLAASEIRERYADCLQLEYGLYRTVSELLLTRIASEGQPFLRAMDALREIEVALASTAGDDVYRGYDFEDNAPLPPGAAQLMDSEPYREIVDYLHQELSWSSICHNYVGFVDAISGNLVTGWATDLSNSGPIEIAVWREGEEVARSLASKPRPDVLKSGVPHERVGFGIELDHVVEEPNKYKVCFNRSTICLPRAAPSRR